MGGEASQRSSCAQSVPRKKACALSAVTPPMLNIVLFAQPRRLDLQNSTVKLDQRG